MGIDTRQEACCADMGGIGRDMGGAVLRPEALLCVALANPPSAKCTVVVCASLETGVGARWLLPAGWAGVWGEAAVLCLASRMARKAGKLE